MEQGKVASGPCQFTFVTPEPTKLGTPEDFCGECTSPGDKYQAPHCGSRTTRTCNYARCTRRASANWAREPS